MINWNVTQKDSKIISEIVKRGFGEVKNIYADTLAMEMDIIAVHLNDCKLKLQELLMADDFNFYHDIFGIASNLDRDTGKLKNCFLPRFTRPH